MLKIQIFGASGSGVTTLGSYISKLWDVPYYDSDYFFWEKTDPPFTIRRLPELRNSMLLEELNSQENWLLGGSIIKWDLDLAYDLVIFLWLPVEIRLDRLKKRENERYGNAIYTDPQLNAIYEEFINWSAGYDNNSARGRTLEAHEKWIKELKSPVLEIRGDHTLEERVSMIKEKLKSLGKPVEHLE